MNRWTPLLAALAVPCVACSIPSKDGGSILESSDGGDASTSSSPTSSSDASSSPTSSSDASSGDDATDTGTSVAPACAARGWDTSLATFQELAAAADGHYWYTTTRASYTEDWTPDCYYTTTLEVAGGVVIRRRMPAGEPGPGAGPGCVLDPIDEMGADVGQLDEYVVAPPWPLEQLYAGCCDDVLTVMPADQYSIEFETFDSGLMRSCFAVPLDCADGCDFGPEGYGSIVIDEVGFGPLPG